MAKYLEKFKKMKAREKALLVIALIVMFYLSIDKVIVTPFLKSTNETKERLETQKKLLKKYYSYINNKKQYEAKINELKQYYTKMQEKFISEETEDLASAKLQEMINNIARSTASKKEIINKQPYLIALSISIEINDINSSQKLQNFLYDIEYNSDKFLFIDNLKIKTSGLNVIKGATVSSTLTAIASIEKKT